MTLRITLLTSLIKFAGANPDQIESTIKMIEMGMKPLKKLSAEDEFETIIAGSKLVCVDFFATWCPPCMGIAPVLVEMAHEMKETVEFIKVRGVKKLILKQNSIQ